MAKRAVALVAPSEARFDLADQLGVPIILVDVAAVAIGPVTSLQLTSMLSRLEVAS